MLDRNRTLKYRYAILRAIKPDDVVIDFGCGTGILGFFALQAGARHVYAIEETTIIEYAKRLAAANDFADKISFIHKPGKKVTEQDIPEKVDIILSEPISNLLVEGDLWSSLHYLKHFLKPKGMIVPESGSLFIVPVKAPTQTFLDADRYLGGVNVYGVNFNGLPQGVFYESDHKPDEWLSDPQPLCEYHLLRDTLTDTIQNSVSCPILHVGKLFGVELYFEVRLFEDILLFSRELEGYASWAPLFAPSPEQAYMCPGDQLQITVKSVILNSWRQIWSFAFEHHSKLLPADDSWWTSETTIPTLLPGVEVHQQELVRLQKDIYYNYTCKQPLEMEFIALFQKNLTCQEICTTIFQSNKYEMTYEAIQKALVEFIHTLLRVSLISLPVPADRLKTTHFQSEIHIP
ncbi:MAG: 50S ribosomal protein L11 methyltransferase [Candidatus Helarchaeota archaeon]|nr:50S ribosomal protein L11 methyltransferase [Candidatus Helarchaeota archaeon]